MTAPAHPFSEVAPGVVSVDALSARCCRDMIEAAEQGPPWIQAEITNYDDKGMLAQYVDLASRNVQVKGPAQLPDQCASYASLLANVHSSVVSKVWDLGELTVSGPQLAKYVRGSHIRPHKDTATGFSRRCLSCLLYLNHDYDGGELHFPRLDFSLRPRRGQLVIFPSEYLHAVFPIVSGVRYCFVAFFLAVVSPLAVLFPAQE